MAAHVALTRDQIPGSLPIGTLPHPRHFSESDFYETPSLTDHVMRWWRQRPCFPGRCSGRMVGNSVVGHSSRYACSIERQEFPAPGAAPSPPCSHLQSLEPRWPTWRVFAPLPSQPHRSSQGPARRLLAAQQAEQPVSLCALWGVRSYSRSRSADGQAGMPPRLCFEDSGQMLEEFPMGRWAVEGWLTGCPPRRRLRGFDQPVGAEGYRERRSMRPSRLAQRGDWDLSESR